MLIGARACGLRPEEDLSSLGLRAGKEAAGGRTWTGLEHGFAFPDGFAMPASRIILLSEYGMVLILGQLACSTQLREIQYVCVCVYVSQYV